MEAQPTLILTIPVSFAKSSLRLYGIIGSCGLGLNGESQGCPVFFHAQAMISRSFLLSLLAMIAVPTYDAPNGVSNRDVKRSILTANRCRTASFQDANELLPFRYSPCSDNISADSRHADGSCVRV